MALKLGKQGAAHTRKLGPAASKEAAYPTSVAG